MTREYKVWAAMRQRCLNPKTAGYTNYGGRGIEICPEWSDFKVFLADMGPCPLGRSIDRIDNDGNYEPGNCRWATRKEQARNRRSNSVLTFRGETHCLVEWAEIVGISYLTLTNRLKKYGWPAKRALTEPLHVHTRTQGPCAMCSVTPDKLIRGLCGACYGYARSHKLITCRKYAKRDRKAMAETIAMMAETQDKRPADEDDYQAPKSRRL